MGGKKKIFFDVRMLGEFSVMHDGQKVILGRNNTLKYIQLIQIVWLHGDQGVTRDYLMHTLYDREELSNSGNSLNNLLYQVRQRMAKEELPKGDYISRKGSMFFTDKSFPVRVDVLEFERLFQCADEAETEEEQYRCYYEAFDLYRGELLPSVSTEMWVMMESLRLKELYVECVEWLGEYCRRNNDYDTMYYVYTRAASIYPYDDWQICQIDSLLALGDTKKANQIYNETVRRYMDEMGIPPSDEMQKCYERISQESQQLPGGMSEVLKSLLEQGESELPDTGAYHCAYLSFVDVYRTLSRNMERSGNSIFLMLCTLVDYEGKMIRNPEKLKDRSKVLGEVIQSSLRKGDVYTQYHTAQYLILLIGAKQEECETIFRRIQRRLREREGNRAGLTYAVSSLAEIEDAGM